MRKFTLTSLFLCQLLIIASCSKDLVTPDIEKEIITEPEENTNVKLSSMTVVTGGTTHSYTYVYESDQLKQIIHSGNHSVDTSFYSYTDSTIINYHRNVAEGTTRRDTLYVADNKLQKISGWNHKEDGNIAQRTVSEYVFNERFIEKFIAKTYSTVISTPLSTSRYNTTNIEDHSLVFSYSFGVIASSADKYKVFFDDSNKVDSIHLTTGFMSEAPEKRYLYTYTTNQITVHTYDKSNNIANTDIVTIDNGSKKIIKVERFDAGNNKYYEENRTYISGASNHELLLYKHPLRNNVVLLKSYY